MGFFFERLNFFEFFFAAIVNSELPRRKTWVAGVGGENSRKQTPGAHQFVDSVHKVCIKKMKRPKKKEVVSGGIFRNECLPQLVARGRSPPPDMGHKLAIVASETALDSMSNTDEKKRV